MPPRRRRSVKPRDPEKARRAALTVKRVVYLAVLTVATGLFAFFVDLWPTPWLGRAAAWLFSVSGILLAAKLLDERPSASRRRARYRVWSSVNALVRDGIRMISVTSRSAAVGVSTTSSPFVSPNTRMHELDDEANHTGALSSLPPSAMLAPPTPPSRSGTLPAEPEARADELLGVITAFPVALQHHLLGTRALPHPPLCDLLPQGYLASLKRTEARVRFATTHAGPSGSGSPKSGKNGQAVNGNDVQSDSDSDATAAPVATKKSNLQAPYPSNLPLSLLRLMEAYILGLGSLPSERGGWSTLQTERTLDIVKGLNARLSEAEGIYSDPPPMINIRLCLDIFLVCLPLWLVTITRGWMAVLLTLAVGTWAKFGVEPALSEPDPASNGHPLKQTTWQMLHEALDSCPALARYYRARLAARLGGDSPEVVELDRRNRRDRDEWLPAFA